MFSALAAAVPAALSFFGGELANRRQSDQAEAANAFSAQQYATRYQTTVADMKAAGINPMLAYGSGPGQAPSGQQAQVTNSGRDVGALAMQGRLNEAQVKLLEAQANQANSAAALAADQLSSGGLGGAEVKLKGSSAAVNEKQLEVMDSTIAKLKEEIVLTSRNASNAHTQGQVLRATVTQLEEQARLLSAQRLTQSEIQEQLRATVEKLKSETQLNLLDIDAALKFENFGREFQQYKPIIDLLKSVLGRGR